jgi:hypothetical protein
MKLVVLALVSVLTWCGLIVGVAVGAAFGTLASMSTIFAAFLNPVFHEELRRTELLTVTALTLAAEKAREVLSA